MKFEQIPLAVTGISHKTAPVEIRESAALSKDEQIAILKQFLEHEYTQGTIVLSTCNRTEVYLSSEHIEASLSVLHAWFREQKSIDYFETANAYLYTGHDALFHFFKVISSLDSQIIGETQITGQVKDAYTLAFELKATDSLLNKIFHFGIQAQKKVRNDTYLCQGAVSISFAGVELAEKIFADMQNRTVLLIGAGETAELCAEHFRKKGVSRFRIANRTFKKAQLLAETFNGCAFEMNDLESAFENVDIAIAATASQNYVLTTELIKKIARERKNRSLLLIDLAIPRDIDPSVNKLADVYLYNLDDLREIVKINSEKRSSEIPKADKILEGMIKDFDEWFATYSLSMTISKLKSYFERLFHHETNRISKNMPAEARPGLEELQRNLTNKLVRQYIKLLKKNSTTIDQQTYIELIHNLLELD